MGHLVILRDSILYSTCFRLQGIVGNDGRHYVLDLLRTFPPDANYFPGWESYTAYF